MTLTVTFCRFGTITLRSKEGFWVGPGLGNFRNAKEAREWARRNGHKIARKYNRET